MPTDRRHLETDTAMTALKIIVASTRPGSSGPAIAGWVTEAARRSTEFDSVDVLDLAEINLPFLDEPHHPKLGRYTKPHTLAWAREISTADALVIVTPEYNSGFPAPLKNAIDFLHAEWKNKALGLVTYGGGASGGARAGRMLQPVTTALGLVTAEQTVAISGAAGQLVAGEFVPTVEDDASAIAMLTEVAEIESELRPVRVPLAMAS
jgi:NAD(P)H-dependent FMN reductase